RVRIPPAPAGVPPPPPARRGRGDRRGCRSPTSTTFPCPATSIKSLIPVRHPVTGFSANEMRPARIADKISVVRAASTRYTVFYDADCRICARSRRAIERLRPSFELVFVNVQDTAAMSPYPMVDRAAGLGQM